MKKLSDCWDWLVGPEDYQPSIFEMLMMAIFCTLIAASVDFTPWHWAVR